MMPVQTMKEESSTSSLLPLFVILLLLLALPAGYWFWSQSGEEPGTTLVTEPTRSAPPVITAATVIPATEPEPATPSPAPIEEKPQPARVASPPQAKPPLTIERDAEGTINLIIDRQAIEAQTRAAAIQVPPLGGVASSETVEAQTPSAKDGLQASAASHTGNATITAHPVDDETPLKPDADWPKPPSPTGLEPCDCTHIVVPGDTLWDIAEHYTGNAFNYHDLAKRSGISNPDRIYPGNKVRIIIR